MRCSLFAALATLPVAAVLGAGIARADESRAEQLRRLLAARSLPSPESLAPEGGPYDAQNGAMRICAQFAQSTPSPRRPAIGQRAMP